MSNQFGFVSEETYAEKMDTQNQFLAALVTAQGGSLKPTSWSDVQAMVRAGLHSRVFAIGDQLTCKKGTDTLVWDIIGIDHDTPTDPQFKHSLTLQLHDCYKNTMQFDAREAFYYAETEMPAGTYHFKLAAHSWYAADVGKSFQFTLTKAVPAGGQIVFVQGYDKTLVNGTVQTFESSTSTTVIETATMTVGTGGTGLGDLDNTVHDNMNSCQRALLGSNNYKESAIRQWLDSDKAAGSVWTPQTKFDRPPSWVSNTAGWTSDIDSDFLAVLGKTHIVVSRNTVCDGGGSDEMNDTFFFLSRREVYMGNEVASVVEGEPYPYYSDYSDLSAPGTGADSNRIKYRNGAAQYWWNRTPYAGYGFHVRGVYTTGAVNYNAASFSYGVAPACNII